MRGRTETVQHTTAPVFIKTLELEFLFEEQQTLRAEIYNETDPSK